MDVPECVGVLWCQGAGLPPRTLDELTAWGRQLDLYDPATGTWRCPGQAPIVPTEGYPGPSGTTALPIPGWVWPAGLAALAVLVLVPKKRR